MLLARVCARRPLASLAVIAVLTLTFATRLPRLELRTDGAVLHPSGDPAVERTARDRVIFGDPEELILLLTARPGGPNLRSAVGLRTLAQVHEAVAALPGIRTAGVRSAAGLIDVATSSLASIGTFLEEISPDRAARAALVRRMRERPSVEGLFLSADGGAAAIYAPLESGRDRGETLHEVGRWAEARADGPFELRLTGPVVAETLLGERILADLAGLVPVMVLVVAALLLVGLRTPGGVLVALGKPLVVLVWTGGLMELTGVPITLVTTILPVLLLALCVTDEVHVVARFQRSLARSANRSTGRRDVLLATLRELYRPVVYTSISTAIGFLSFLSASIVPMRHFGVLAAVGILSAMLMTFTLTPALGMLLPVSWFMPRFAPRGPRTCTTGARRSRTVPPGSSGDRRRAAALLAGILLLVAGAPGLLRLTVQDSWIANFDPDSELVQAEREFNANFWGTYRFDVVLTGRPGSFHRPEGLALVEAAARAGASSPHAGGVVSPLQSLDTVARLLGLAGGASTLPTDALQAVVRVASELPRGTDLQRLMTADGRAVRLMILVNTPDYRKASALAEHVERELAALPGVSYHTSGDLPLAVATVRAIVAGQLRSIAWTLAGVGLLLLLVNRSLRLTLVQIFPPAAAAWLILSVMGYAGLPLGIATSMFTALTLGVGVDLALHVTYAYEDRRSSGAAGGLAPADAVREAFESTEAGRRWSTVILCLGFLVLTASAFGPSHDLGILLCGAMLASYLVTSLFLPWMLAR